jgi:hypothetical protein
MEDSFWKAGKLLSYDLNSVLEVLKKNVVSFEPMEDLTDQKDKDLKWIQELGKEVNQLHEEISQLQK